MNYRKGRWSPENFNKEVAFWKRVEQNGECLEWMGARDPDGYGNASYRSRSTKAHRVAWFLTVGKIRKGLVLDHHCRNPACVNPEHLEPITNKENVVARGVYSITAIQARQTHCKRGHEFNKINTRIDKKGARICELCRYIRNGYSLQRFGLPTEGEG